MKPYRVKELIQQLNQAPSLVIAKAVAVKLAAELRLAVTCEKCGGSGVTPPTRHGEDAWIHGDGSRNCRKCGGLGCIIPSAEVQS